MQNTVECKSPTSTPYAAAHISHVQTGLFHLSDHIVQPAGHRPGPRGQRQQRRPNQRTFGKNNFGNFLFQTKLFNLYGVLTKGQVTTFLPEFYIVSYSKKCGYLILC